VSQRDEINISHIPVSGIGGLGMVAAAIAVAIAQPGLRWPATVSLLGGVAIGLAVIGLRHRGARHAAEWGGLILVLAVAVGAWLYFRS
jgi:hypothetical protein